MINIATKAYIEHQILMHAKDNGHLRVSAKTIEESYGLTNGEFGLGVDSEIRCLSLLYFLLVFPKEKFSRDGMQVDVSRMGFSNSQLIRSGAKLDGIEDESQLLRCLRNSVAHADLEVKKDCVIFTSQPNSKTEYEVVLTWETLSDLLTKIGQYFSQLDKRTSYGKRRIS